MQKIQYTPEKCECCKQNTTYVLAIDRGTAEIVKQIARFIGKKGSNFVHPRKEMEGAYLTSNQVGNLSRPRNHGLIARVKGNPGNYLLTKKGARFLRGEAISKFAIVSKAEHKQVGYFEADKHLVRITDFNSTSEYWEGINYEVEEGSVIIRKTGDQTLF